MNTTSSISDSSCKYNNFEPLFRTSVYFNHIELLMFIDQDFFRPIPYQIEGCISNKCSHIWQEPDRKYYNLYRSDLQ